MPRPARSHRRLPRSSFRKSLTKSFASPPDGPTTCSWRRLCFLAASITANTTHAPSGSLLTSYAEKLQRPDGLFIHAVDGPHAWGRGNGFALLGVTEALTHLPEELGGSAARAGDLSQTHAGAGGAPVG